MTRQSAKIGEGFKENVDNIFVLTAPNIIKPCHDQTKKNEYAQSGNSDQFTECAQWVAFFMRTVKNLIRLMLRLISVINGLIATLLVFFCCGSIVIS